MFDFHEKRKIRSFLYSKITILMLAFVAVMLSFSVYGRYEVAREMEGKLQFKQAELERLQERASVLEAKVEYLENDRGFEEELRNRFDVAKEGEQTVVLIDSREGDGREASLKVGVPTPPEGESFFDKLVFWD